MIRIIKIKENISSKHYKGNEMIDNTRNKNNTQNNCHNLFIFHGNNNVGQYSITILSTIYILSPPVHGPP
jgi:hypothetical protein